MTSHDEEDADRASAPGGPRARELERALVDGRFEQAERLLAADPALADAHLGLQLALGRRAAVLAALAADRDAASRRIGRRWPIHHLCFSRWHHHAPGLESTMVELLDALLEAGADLEQPFPAEPGSDPGLKALYGALGHAANLTLARALLERGADPNDNESLYHATELGDLEGVRLLFAHGARIGTTNAFYRMLDRESPEGVELFLAHGADPNAPLYTDADGTVRDERNALHHACLRGRSGTVGALLLEAGADAGATYDGKSAYALARIHGNNDMAVMLAGRELATALTPPELLLASIIDNDAPTARRLLTEDPGLLQRLTAADRALQTDFAMNANRLPALELMVELGFDPQQPGESAMPPIHAAAWWGHADIVDFYLGLGVDLEGLNDYGGTALGNAIHGSQNCPGRAAGDHLRCVSALLDAGARLREDHHHLEMGSEAVTRLLRDRLADGSAQRA